MTNWIEFETPWGPHLVDLDRIVTVTKDPEINHANPNGSILWFGNVGDNDYSTTLPICVSYEDIKTLLTGDRLTKLVKLGIPQD